MRVPGNMSARRTPGRLTFTWRLLKPWLKHIGLRCTARSATRKPSLHMPGSLAPALQAAGGRFLARGLPARVYESGLDQRAVLLEFDSVAQAIAAHDSPGYQQALRALGNAADRDMRIVEGVE